MNICITGHAFPPSVGGVESHLWDLSAALVRQGHEVHVLVGPLEGQPTEQELDGVRVHRSELLNLEAVRRRKRAAGLGDQDVCPQLVDEIVTLYWRFVAEHGIDIVHAHDFHSFLPGYATAVARLHQAGMPSVLTVHNTRETAMLDEPCCWTAWDAIVSVSRHVEKVLRERLQSRGTDVRVIYQGIDTGTVFTPHNSGSVPADKLGLRGRPVVIHPARMLPWKGVIHTVVAMARVLEHFPTAVLIVTDSSDITDWAGERDDYRKAILQVIESMGMQDHVIFKSFPRQELAQVYNYCDVVAYPSVGPEALGLVPIEAMACARPVVVSDSGGMPETVVDGVTGFVIRRNDVRALADRICRVLGDPELAKRMGRAGRHRAVKHFSRERMARQTAALYSQALRRPLPLGR